MAISGQEAEGLSFLWLASACENRGGGAAEEKKA